MFSKISEGQGVTEKKLIRVLFCWPTKKGTVNTHIYEYTVNSFKSRNIFAMLFLPKPLADHCGPLRTTRVPRTSV
jgi:hypothetical protein